MTLADRIREARKAKDMSQAALATAVGLTQQAIGQIETGATKVPASWRELARVLEIPEEEFAELMREGQRDSRRDRGSAPAGARAPMPPIRPYRKIPVLGRVAGSPFGEGHLIMNQTVDQTECPPWLDEAEEAYALYVVGESMVPRFLPGELIFVHPWRQPRPGDYVVAQIKNSDSTEISGYVKQLVRADKRGVLVRQLFPKEEDLPIFPTSSVLKLHKIIIPGLN